MSKGTCNLPPPGWYCSLEMGHTGPCPTWPEKRGCEGCGDIITGEAWHYICAASYIDEERLARALHAIDYRCDGSRCDPDGDDFSEWHRASARAIAAAYREEIKK